MTLPRVTIVTPSYNQAHFLEQTIRSVLAQDYPNIEYIVMDGGSTDGSVEIIKKYADRIDYWASAPDGGQTAALRKGFARATGEMLAWLNSDDFYYPHAVSTAVAAFASAPTAGVVTGGCRIVEPSGRPLRDMAAQPVPLADLLWANDIRQPSTFFTRSAYEQSGGLDATFHYSMDYDLWLRLLTLASLKTVPQTLAAFRLHPSSKTVSRADAFLAEDLRAVESYLASPAGQRLPPALRRRVRARRLLLCLEAAAPESPDARNLTASIVSLTPGLSPLEVGHALAGIQPRGWGEQAAEREAIGAPTFTARRLVRSLKSVVRARYGSVDSLAAVGALTGVEAHLSQFALRVFLAVLPWNMAQRLLIARKNASRLCLDASLNVLTSQRTHRTSLAKDTVSRLTSGITGRRSVEARPGVKQVKEPPTPTIAYVSDIGQLGGAELSTLEEAAHHQALGQRMVLVCPPSGPLAARASELGIPAFAVAIPGVLPVHGAPARAKAAISLVASIWRLRTVLREQQADVVCGSSAKSAVLAGLAAKLRGHRPTVIAINHEQFYFDEFFSKTIYFRLIRRILLLLCDYIVVLTPARHNRLRARIGDRRAVLTRISLILGPFAEACGRGIRDELKIAPSETLVGVVGAISPAKGQHDFLNAAAKIAAVHPELRCVVVGDTAITADAEYRDQLVRLRHSLNLDERVTFMGWRDDMPNVMAALDIFVHASHSDSFGRVVVEAMAAGKAVIATAVEGPSQLVLHGQTGFLVPPGDPNALAAALERLLEHPGERRRLGQLAQAWVQATFGQPAPDGQTLAGVCARIIGRPAEKTRSLSDRCIA